MRQEESVWLIFCMNNDLLDCILLANKGLSTINFREEDEKFNVWVAYLNLEHKYGSMDSLEAAFLRAIQESKSNYTISSI